MGTDTGTINNLYILTALGALPPPAAGTWLLLGWLPFTFLKAFTHLLLIRPVTLALKSIECHTKKTKELHICTLQSILSLSSDNKFCTKIERKKIPRSAALNSNKTVILLLHGFVKQSFLQKCYYFQIINVCLTCARMPESFI